MQSNNIQLFSPLGNRTLAGEAKSVVATSAEVMVENQSHGKKESRLNPVSDDLSGFEQCAINTIPPSFGEKNNLVGKENPPYSVGKGGKRYLCLVEQNKNTEPTSSGWMTKKQLNQAEYMKWMGNTSHGKMKSLPSHIARTRGGAIEKDSSSTVKEEELSKDVDNINKERKQEPVARAILPDAKKGILSNSEGGVILIPNPTDEKMDNVLPFNANKDDGKKDPQGPDVSSDYQSVMKRATSSLLTQFDSTTNTKFAVKTYTMTPLPTIFDLSNLGALLVDMPMKQEPVLLEGGYGVSYKIAYRWSDGGLTKDVKETLLTEKISDVMLTNLDIGPIPSGTTPYFFKIPVIAGLAEGLESPYGYLESAKKIKLILGGKDESVSYALLTKYANLMSVGDNHVTFLVSMLRYYFSAVMGRALGCQVDRARRLPRDAYTLVGEANSWMEHLNNTDDAIVRCKFDNPDMLHFYTTCSQKGKTLYPMRMPEDKEYVTLFDALDLRYERTIRVLCPYRYNISTIQPYWVGDAGLIKSYIEAYADSVGIKQQVGEAIRCTQFLVFMRSSRGGAVLPDPVHSSDVLADFVESSSDASAMNTLVEHGEFRQIFGNFLSKNLLDEALNTWVEGALADRNRAQLSRDDESFVLSTLNIARSAKSTALIALAKEMTGIDFSFMMQLQGGIWMFEQLLNKIRNPTKSTLFKLLLPVKVKDSTADLISRGLIMVKENVNSLRLRVPWSTSWVLSKLNFGRASSDVTEAWDDHPWNMDSTMTLKIHEDKKLQYWAIADKVCKMHFEYISFGDDTHTLALDSFEDSLDAYLDKLYDSQPRHVVLPTIVKQRDDSILEKEDRLAGLKKNLRIGDDGKLRLGATQSKVVFNPDDAKSLDDEELKQIMTATEPDRRLTKENAAMSVYTYPIEDTDFAKQEYESQRWMPEPNEGGGDCGPLSFISGLLDILGGQHKEMTVTKLRSIVCGKQGLRPIAKEWWLESDFTVAGSIFGISIVCHYEGELSGEQCYYRCRGKTMVIQNTGNYHWECLKVVGALDEPKLIDVDAGIVSDTNYPALEPPRASVREVVEHLASKSQIPSHVAKRKGGSNNPPKGTSRHIEDKVVWKDAVRIRMVSSILSKAKNHIPSVPSNEELLGLLKGRPSALGMQIKDDFDALKMPILNTNMDGVLGISALVPVWVVNLVRIYDNVVTWRSIKALFDQSAIPKPIAQLWHLLIYPMATLPIEISYVRDSPYESSKCGCYACDTVVTLDPICICCGVESECGWGRGVKGKSNEFMSLPDLLPRTLKSGVKKKDFRLLNSFFPFPRSIGARKSNMDLGTAVWLAYTKVVKCSNMWKLVRDTLLRRVGDSNHLTTSIIVWLIGNTCSATGRNVSKHFGLLSTCTKHWIDHMKVIHDHLRSTRAYDGIELSSEDHSQLLYTHLLYGRLGDEVDWADEKTKRTRERVKMVATNGGPWTEDVATEKIKNNIDALVSRMVPARKSLETLEHFWSRRWEWMAGGAAPGLGKVLTPEEAANACGLDVKRATQGNNKRSVCEKIDIGEIRTFLEQEPIQRSYAHTKANELAKTRSIFGVEVFHYVAANYFSCLIEDSIVEPGMHIKDEVARGVAGMITRQSWCTNGYEVNSFDFADFNDQHELWVMEYLHESFARWIKVHYPNDEARDDTLKCIDWIGKSFLKSTYYDKVNDEWVELSGGMFSGNRATTLINTILNKVYLEMVDDCVEVMYGERCLKKTYHTGDDMVGIVKDHALSLAFNSCAYKCNIEANPEKQISDKGYLEYLRLSYYPCGAIRGSLCRALGTFINGNWESEVGNDSLARARAIWDQSSVLMRRGLEVNFSNVICDDLVNYYSRSIHKNAQTESVSKDLMQLSVKNGGLGLPNLGSTKCLKSTLSISTSVAPKAINIDGIEHKLKASKEYIKYLNKERLPRDGKIEGANQKLMLQALATQTVGLELPRHATVVGASSREIERMNNSARDATAHEEQDERLGDEGDSLGQVIRSKNFLAKFKRLHGKYSKLKEVVKYVTFRAGLDKNEFIQKELKVDIERVKKLDVPVDRCDGGTIPPHFWALINNYSTIYGVGTLNAVHDYSKETSLYARIKY